MYYWTPDIHGGEEPQAPITGMVAGLGLVFHRKLPNMLSFRSPY